MGRHQILSFLCFLFFFHSTLPFASSLCPPDQRDALLDFKNSFGASHNYYYRERPGFVCELDVRGYSSDPTTVLWNEFDCCSWNGVTCDSVTGNVIGLDLPRSGLRGAFHSNSSLFLPKLEVLRLSSCNLTRFPYFLNSLKTLANLDLSFNRISGKIPRWFWGIGDDTLKHLDLSHNLFEGVIHQLNWKRLSYINLQNNLFQGPLPIPSPSTCYFYANDNGFTGEISSSICQLSSLLDLDLSNNNFSGNMPLCFGNITKLVLLDLSNNSLLGNIPHSFDNIINLGSLNLSSNKLQGPLPRFLVKYANLSNLDLSHNKFNDIFPHWLEAMKLIYLDLQSNKFYGRINLTTFGLSFPVLRYLLISNNNFTGQLPTNVFFNSSLDVIDLSNNKFGGPIPLPSPSTMYYSITSNNITGKVSSLICNATNLQMIDLSNNSLTGSLPWCLTNFSTALSVLNLGMNLLEGTIPQSISLMCGLTTLDLSRNGFEGTLPRSLVNCTDLEILDLNSNRIEGTFPKWLGKLPKLKVLILRSNNFKGHLNIPKGDLLFLKLHILDLSNNNFSGPLPTNLIMNLKGMINAKTRQDTSLYMTTTTFSSSPYESSVTLTIKGKYTKLVKILTMFTTIDLSHNFFQGDIPRVIGHLHFLIGLNLSHNYLIGSIPLALGNLSNLEWLDLSSNMLSGVIPRKLGDLAFLGYLDLSKNQLTGRIPQDKQLITFSRESFSGNPGLCGTPLPKSCPGDAQPPPPSSLSTFNPKVHGSWFKQKVVWLGYASGTVIGISITYIAFEMRRPKWLVHVVRMLERKVSEWMEKSKEKSIKFHGQ